MARFSPHVDSHFPGNINQGQWQPPELDDPNRIHQPHFLADNSDRWPRPRPQQWTKTISQQLLCRNLFDFTLTHKLPVWKKQFNVASMLSICYIPLPRVLVLSGLKCVPNSVPSLRSKIFCWMTLCQHSRAGLIIFIELVCFGFNFDFPSRSGKILFLVHFCSFQYTSIFWHSFCLSATERARKRELTVYICHWRFLFCFSFSRWL